VSETRFFCKLCNVGQGITAKATDLQRQAFDRFVEEHRGCASDLAVVERVRKTIPRRPNVGR
jgi:hypothetical protein